MAHSNAFEATCANRACNRAAPCGLGWGFGSGLTQWFCLEHFPAALARLAGLLTWNEEKSA